MNEELKKIAESVNRIIVNQWASFALVGIIALVLLLGRSGARQDEGHLGEGGRFQLINANAVFDRSSGVLYEKDSTTIVETDFVLGRERVRSITRTEK